MASNNTFATAIIGLKCLGMDLKLRSYLTPEEIHNLSYIIKSDSDEIITTHERELAAKDDERLTIVANYEHVIAAKDREISELQRRLKVAEDYIAKLAKIDTHPSFPDSTLAIIRHNARNALAAIRGEGGES